MLEFERSELLLSAKGVLFPCDGVQCQLLLHTMALLLKLELIQLLLRVREPPSEEEIKSRARASTRALLTLYAPARAVA